jgi:hypothetical protein
MMQLGWFAKFFKMVSVAMWVGGGVISPGARSPSLLTVPGVRKGEEMVENTLLVSCGRVGSNLLHFEDDDEELMTFSL